MKRGMISIRPLFIATLLGVVACAIGRVQAQGIERESLAGEAAAGAVHGSDEDQPYNVQLGPVNLRASTAFSTSYNDNINVAHTGRQTDVILTPSADISGIWQATELNALTFNLGIGYEYYTMHSGTSSLVLSPDSATEFNVFVGDFRINLHDRFSYQQDPIQVGQLSNASQFSRFQNQAGITVDWDLGDMILTSGYDHSNLWVFQSNLDYLTYQTDSVTESATFKISKTIDAGIEVTASDSRYDKNVQNDSVTIEGGPFVTAQISENLAFNAHAGWQYSNFDTGGSNGDTEDIDSFYGNLGINHRINDVLRESLTGGQEYIPGITSNFTQRVYANYMLSWKATQFIDLSSNFWWENLEDSNASVRQTANRYGAGLTLGYKITDHANISAGYTYVLKDADPSIFSYYQNQATLGFRYQF
jgi:hypothetical protein